MISHTRPLDSYEPGIMIFDLDIRARLEDKQDSHWGKIRSRWGAPSAEVIATLKAEALMTVLVTLNSPLAHLAKYRSGENDMLLAL